MKLLGPKKKPSIVNFFTVRSDVKIRNLILALAALSLLHGAPVDASSAKCNAGTLKATALHNSCVMKATAAHWLRPNGTKFAKRVSRCEARITRAFNRAQRVHGGEACTTESPAAYIQANTQFSNVVANVTNAQESFDLCSPSQVDLVGGTCGTRLGPAAGEIPGCDGAPYIQPQKSLNAGAWFWDVDDGVDPKKGAKINPDHLEWGATKAAVGQDMVAVNAGLATKNIADTRIQAIKDLNLSPFQQNAAGANVHFKLTYIYSEDIKLQFSVKQMALKIGDIDNLDVIFFDKGMNDAHFVTGKVDETNLKTAGGETVDISSSLDQVHLQVAYDTVSYWLTGLQNIGVTADNLASFDLGGADAQDWTTNAMLMAARYNVYARAQSPALPTYNYFNLDSEPGNNAALRTTYLSINSAILKLFGPGTAFNMPIAAYVNQQQMGDGFAGEVCDAAHAMVFGTNRPDPQQQCIAPSQGKFCLPPTETRCENHPWTFGWEGSLHPLGAPVSSPMCSVATVASVREMADVAIAEAAACSPPMTVDANPSATFSSFLALWAQLVEGGYTCP